MKCNRQDLICTVYSQDCYVNTSDNVAELVHKTLPMTANMHMTHGQDTGYSCALLPHVMGSHAANCKQTVVKQEVP